MVFQTPVESCGTGICGGQAGISQGIPAPSGLLVPQTGGQGEVDTRGDVVPRGRAAFRGRELPLVLIL